MTVPNSTYRVLIQAYDGTSAVRPWHNAKRNCEEATVVAVSAVGTQNLVALPGSDVSGTVTSSNGKVDSG